MRMMGKFGRKSKLIHIVKVVKAASKVKNALLALAALGVLAAGGFWAYGLFSGIARTANASNSEELLHYYAAGQERYKAGHGSYGTVRQLLEDKALYLGARGDIPWAEEMERHGYRFRFSVGAKGSSYLGEGKAPGLKDLRVSSP